MKKKLLLLFIIFTSIKLSGQCSIANQSVSATQSVFCPSGGATTIILGSSEIGIDYYLIDNFSNSVVDGPVLGTGSSISFSTGIIFSTITYYIYAEEAANSTCNFQLSQTVTITVEDINAPIPDVAVLADVTGECSITVSAPTATDDCAGTITGTTLDATTYNLQGMYIITWEYNDGNGNIATQAQSVIIDDITAPVPDVVILADATDECSVTVSAPTATDACEGIVTGTTLDATSYNTQGIHTITWTYEDSEGNTSTQTQDVILTDITDPVPDVAVLADVTAECSISVPAPTATDNCEGVITGTTSDPTTYNSQGVYTITWTYDDGNGNTFSQTQSVFITDVTAPVPDVVTLVDITGVCSVTSVGAPTATDACEGIIAGATTDPISYNIPGNYTITWSYNDGNGNTSTQIQKIIVTVVDTSVTITGATLSANAIGGATYEWVDCATNSTIPGETAQNFTATDPGSYALQITENGCTERSVCFDILSTGISKRSKYDVTIYPNPTSGSVTIDLPTKVEGKIIVRDVLGQIIISKEINSQQISIDLSDFFNGMYLIGIETAVSNQILKVSKY